MSKSSINFKPAKSNSEFHNERKQELDYNFPELIVNNESWINDRIKNQQKKIEDYCKKKSGRKLQKNATPIREAVVNINADHGMKDLKNLAKSLQEKKGIECFQIHIHRDEGKSRKQLNYHAHMLFNWQDKKTGKMLRLNKVEMSKIQTLVANNLGMERGELKVNSNRERLEPIELKRQYVEAELSELQTQINVLEQKKNNLKSRNKSGKERRKASIIKRLNREDFTGLPVKETTQIINGEIERNQRVIDQVGEEYKRGEEEHKRSEKEHKIIARRLQEFKAILGESKIRKEEVEKAIRDYKIAAGKLQKART